jgi:hypothetical protein
VISYVEISEDRHGGWWVVALLPGCNGDDERTERRGPYASLWEAACVAASLDALSKGGRPCA